MLKSPIPPSLLIIIIISSSALVVSLYLLHLSLLPLILRLLLMEKLCVAPGARNYRPTQFVSKLLSNFRSLHNSISFRSIQFYRSRRRLQSAT